MAKKDIKKIIEKGIDKSKQTNKQTNLGREGAESTRGSGTSTRPKKDNK